MSPDQRDTDNAAAQRFGLLVVALGCSAAAILYYSLPWGIGVSPDSVAYLKAANRVANDLQFNALPTHWPPGYPLFLAAFMAFMPGMTTAALFAQTMLFAINTILVALVTLRCLKPEGNSRFWIAGLTTVFFACNPAVLLVHQYAVSEALFVFFMLTGLLACFRAARKGGIHRLVIAALIVGCLPVVRYAGLPLLLAYALFVYLLWQGESATPRTKWMASCIFLGVATLPIAAWHGFNTMFRADATNRTLELHPVGLPHLQDFWSVVQGWFHVAPHYSLTILAIASISIGIYLSYSSLHNEDVRKSLISVFLLSGSGYVLFLLISISVVYANIPLDRRILLPCWLLLLLTIAVSLQVSTARKTHMLALAVPLVAVMLGYLAKSSHQVTHSMGYGLGYQLRGASESGLMQLVKDRSSGVTLYSNARDYIFLHTGIEVEPLPAIYSAATTKRNPDFVVKMAEILAEIDRGESGIVYMHRFEFRQYYPTIDQLREDFYLESGGSYGDGEFLHRLRRAD
jgi:hypothetical protein